MLSKSVILCLFFIWTSSVTYAAQWAIKASVNQETAYDDNVRLTTVRQGSMSIKIKPILSLTHSTDYSEIKATANYGMQYFTNSSGLNKPSQHYALSSYFRTSRFKLGLAGSYTSQPSYYTASIYTGNFTSNAIQSTLTVSPTISYQLTEADSFSLSSSYINTSYSNNSYNQSQNTNPSNYQAKNLGIGWQRQWTERYSSTLNLFYTNYNTQGNGYPNSSNSYGTNISLKYLLSEKWTTNASIGGRLTNSDNSTGIGNIKTTSSGFLFNMESSYSGKGFVSRASFNRSLMPSSGQLSIQNTINFELEHKLSERLNIAINGIYLQSTTTNNNSNRSYIGIQPSISWEFSRYILLSCNYRYRYQLNSTIADQTGYSNMLMLSINYNWQGLNVSR